MPAEENGTVDFSGLASDLASDGQRRSEALSKLSVYMEDPRVPLTEKGSTLTSHIPMSLLFNCLETSNQSDIDTCCSVLRRVMDSLPRSALLAEDVVAYFTLGLSHPNDKVRELVLMQLLRCTEGEKELARMHTVGLLELGLERIGDDSLGVAKKAGHLLAQLSWTPTGISLLSSPTIVQKLKTLAESNETTRFRIYEATLDAATISDDALAACQAAGLLDGLQSDLVAVDPLLRVNVLEMYAKMGANPASHRYLVESGALDSVSALLKDREDPWAAMCVPFVFRFYARMAEIKGTDFKQLFDQQSLYGPFVRALQGPDPVLAEAALSCCASMASVSSGVATLVASAPLHEAMVRHLAGAQVELRVAAMHATAVLFDNTEAQFDELLAAIFGSLPGKPNVMALLYGFMRQPFAETRDAAYHMLRSLAAHSWGRSAMVSYPGFVELLLDRKDQSDRDALDWKYAIVKAILGHSAGEEELGHAVFRRLAAYLREGAYYVEAAPQVATASGN
eukprot:comp24264_c3_seq5/m.45168 comp24264_c3_seq5/g.45168  ORF comp24264_c3_seq5/g.45168 comp24264_c3_seq5/m.45168 type:complete len:509 (-) comp24264_c3_seq5:17-1543(-)